MKILENQSMKEYSNMKVGGIAKRLIILDNKEEIKEVYKNFDNIFLLGRGTNTLLNDKYLDINFVSTENLNKITKLGDNLVEVEAGVFLGDLINYMKENDYSGLENLTGIPASIGGLTYMNGGAFGTEVFDCIYEIEILDENQNIKRIKKENINFAYRHTEIKKNKWIILSVVFKFEKGFNSARSNEINELRNGKHPLSKPSLGSTFKNPKDNFAAKLIDKAGLKGTIIGGAQVAMEHPNFILNLGDASFEDIENLISLVQNKVRENSGIELETEIIVVK